MFSDSNTPNWGAEKCKPVPPLHVPPADLTLLALAHSDPLKLVSELNHGYEPIRGAFSSMQDLFKTYKIAGVQLWHHGGYEDYKCHGPYIADWGCCSAR